MLCWLRRMLCWLPPDVVLVPAQGGGVRTSRSSPNDVRPAGCARWMEPQVRRSAHISPAQVEWTPRPWWSRRSGLWGSGRFRTRVFVPGVSLRASPSIHATPRRDAIEGRRASYFWPPRVSDGTAGTTFGVGRPERTAPRTPIAAPEVPTRLERAVIGWAVSGTAGRLGTLFHMLHRPGGDWSRQRMSSEEKRAEEADDDLVNHPSEKNQAPTTVSASSPSPPERVATPSDRERLWPGSWRRQRGSPPLSVTDSVGTSHSDWACHIS